MRLHSSKFLLIGIVGCYCVPTVAGWIIGAGGGIGSYGRNVNQTAQRGTQGAYTGSKAMVGEAQVLLPVTSLDVSKGHSLKRSKFPLVEKEVSTSGKFIFHWWKDNFQLVEIRRVPNSRLTHNKMNEQKCLLVVQRSRCLPTKFGQKGFGHSACVAVRLDESG
ncbi:hypothetical protein [Porphyromonas gingivalis]|uniref:hypothetical protein n=1 Tax=Porphyromonas gingivalis TaxID=837 RepID=UPI001E401776|nr:hypothetical protein [Porphyromonas gingivalis]